MNLHCCGEIWERDSAVSVVIHPSQSDVNQVLKCNGSPPKTISAIIMITNTPLKYLSPPSLSPWPRPPPRPRQRHRFSPYNSVHSWSNYLKGENREICFLVWKQDVGERQNVGDKACDIRDTKDHRCWQCFDVQINLTFSIVSISSLHNQWEISFHSGNVSNGNKIKLNWSMNKCKIAIFPWYVAIAVEVVDVKAVSGLLWRVTFRCKLHQRCKISKLCFTMGSFVLRERKKHLKPVRGQNRLMW